LASLITLALQACNGAAHRGVKRTSEWSVPRQIVFMLGATQQVSCLLNGTLDGTLSVKYPRVSAGWSVPWAIFEQGEPVTGPMPSAPVERMGTRGKA